MIQQAVQLRPVPSSTGGGFLEQTLTTGGFERFRLQGVVLFVPFGNAGVAEECASAGRI